MNILQGILTNYSQFFSLHVLITTLTNPANLMIIFSLVILEGLLSTDNALVLAIMVKKLPQNQQKKALVYGIWGAYIFRFIAIGAGAFLIKIWWIKLIAAGYLLHMVYSYFENKGKEEETSTATIIQKGFWATVISVELMDITFSIDSVTAAFGVSGQVWVLFLGAVVGILLMRCVAGLFITLINKVPELETSAYILIAFIGIKMVLALVAIEIPTIIFFFLLIVIFGGTIALHYIKANLNKEIKTV